VPSVDGRGGAIWNIAAKSLGSERLRGGRSTVRASTRQGTAAVQALEDERVSFISSVSHQRGGRRLVIRQPAGASPCARVHTRWFSARTRAAGARPFPVKTSIRLSGDDAPSSEKEQEGRRLSPLLVLNHVMATSTGNYPQSMHLDLFNDVLSLPHRHGFLPPWLALGDRWPG
jgi:hypothetical protein